MLWNAPVSCRGMLLRPTRPLPRRFSRRVTKSTRSFVERRHKRQKQYIHERWKRIFRRGQHVAFQGIGVLRKWVYVAALGVILLGVAYLLFSPSLHVREVRVKRTDARLDSERIQRSLKPVFGKHILFISSHDVRALITEAIPDIATVEMEKQYPSRIVLKITLRPLIARLKITPPDGGASTGSGAPLAAEKQGRPPTAKYDYLADNGVYVSVPLAYFGTVLPTIEIVDWAVRPIPNTILLSPSFLKRMNDTEYAIKDQFNVKTMKRTVFLRAREFHLKTPTISLWFDLRSSIEDQLTRYRTFLRAVGLKEVREYVDLRLTGRVIYR